MYEVIEGFVDLQDYNYRDERGKLGLYEYHPGDIYPRPGYTPTQHRYEELAGTVNRRGRAVIREIPDPEKPRRKRGGRANASGKSD